MNYWAPTEVNHATRPVQCYHSSTRMSSWFREHPKHKNSGTTRIYQLLSEESFLQKCQRLFKDNLIFSKLLFHPLVKITWRWHTEKGKIRNTLSQLLVWKLFLNFILILSKREIFQTLIWHLCSGEAQLWMMTLAILWHLALYCGKSILFPVALFVP